VRHASLVNEEFRINDFRQRDPLLDDAAAILTTRLFTGNFTYSFALVSEHILLYLRKTCLCYGKTEVA